MIHSTVTAPPMSTTEAVTAEIYMFHPTILLFKNPYHVFLTVQETPRFRCGSPTLSDGYSGSEVVHLLHSSGVIPTDFIASVGSCVSLVERSIDFSS